MWLVIFGLIMLGTFAGLIYLCFRLQRFRTVQLFTGGQKKRKWIVSVVFIVVVVILCRIDMVNTMIIVLHLLMFWLIADFFTLIIKWVCMGSGSKRPDKETSPGEGTTEEQKTGPYLTGIFVLAFTALYLCAGWYLAHHVWVTHYAFSTDKDLGQEKLRIVLFADSHIGTTFDGEGFSEHMKSIEAESPDVVLIAGDFVDDDTLKADMVKSCKALGELKSTYGVFYADGNHDRGYYQGRDFSYGEMLDELEKNNVHILRDQAELINGAFYVTGRLDRSNNARLSLKDIIKESDLDPDKYTIVMDHQPNDYEAEAGTGVDLVVSGHTHGGQLFPVNRAGEWIGANDRTYGTEKRDKTTFVVTSGISAWAIWFKTGTKSEFVVIDITEE
ncbi:MAG: metallophosphoesterase [Lachnospiraceae bacterium]|nr:metallophosphoesterase [Lachnospiraceae bacterium]